MMALMTFIMLLVLLSQPMCAALTIREIAVGCA